MRIRITVFPGDDPILDTDEWFCTYRVIPTEDIKTPKEIMRLIADDIAMALIRELERKA